MIPQDVNFGSSLKLEKSPKHASNPFLKLNRHISLFLTSHHENINKIVIEYNEHRILFVYQYPPLKRTVSVS